jgi:hypothetical protein
MFCGIPELEFATTGKVNQAKEAGDIIDEAITQFRAQVLFKTYNPTANGNNADVILMYLTVFMQHCLRDMQKMYNTSKGKVPAKVDCEKAITKLV